MHKDERWTKFRSQIALEKRRNPHADVTELRRSLKAAHLTEYVSRAIESDPPLTDAQRGQVASVLTDDSH